jgi:hypothetical protein
MFTEMTDVMVTNISDRFCDVCLLDPKGFANYQLDFPVEALNFRMKTFGRRFDPVRLKIELVAVYSHVEIHKNVNELKEYIRQQELEDDVFLQTYNLPNSSSEYQL